MQEEKSVSCFLPLKNRGRNEGENVRETILDILRTAIPNKTPKLPQASDAVHSS